MTGTYLLFKLTKLKSLSALATEPSYDAYCEARHGLGLGKLKNIHQVVQPDIAVLFASVQASANLGFILLQASLKLWPRTSLTLMWP